MEVCDTPVSVFISILYIKGISEIRERVLKSGDVFVAHKPLNGTIFSISNINEVKRTTAK